jgi:hypothetical protein
MRASAAALLARPGEQASQEEKPVHRFPNLAKCGPDRLSRGDDHYVVTGRQRRNQRPGSLSHQPSRPVPPDCATNPFAGYEAEARMLEPVEPHDDDEEAILV